MKTQNEARNLSMVMDLYELTMSNGYFEGDDTGSRVVFDVFYRNNPDKGGFSIFAGLEQIIEYIENLHFDNEDIVYLRSLGIFDEKFLDYLKDFKFKGDIYAFEEGTVMYPDEPVITVIAPLIDAQIVETAILLEVNHQSLIATKTRRICYAAGKSWYLILVHAGHTIWMLLYMVQGQHLLEGHHQQQLYLQGRCLEYQ